MTRKENQRIALTRRLLQEGLLRLLEHHKLEDISVTALCKEAGINRATFYNHYTSPTTLLEEMEQHLIAQLQQITSHAENLDDIICQTEQCLILLKENSSLFHMLVWYHVDRDLEKTVEKIARHYDAHRINEMHNDLDSETVHLVSSFLYSGCYSLIREWLLRETDKTPREVAALLVNIVNKDYL